jgi:hypothetical protein
MSEAEPYGLRWADDWNSKNTADAPSTTKIAPGRSAPGLDLIPYHRTPTNNTHHIFNVKRVLTLATRKDSPEGTAGILDTIADESIRDHQTAARTMAAAASFAYLAHEEEICDRIIHTSNASDAQAAPASTGSSHPAMSKIAHTGPHLSSFHAS